MLMLEYAIYSVIPPESCASIIWRDSALAAQAAEALKLTSEEVLGLGIVDKVIPEPLGGAHREAYETAQRIKNEILATLSELDRLPVDELLRQRYQKFRAMGKFSDPAAATEPQAQPEGNAEGGN